MNYAAKVFTTLILTLLSTSALAEVANSFEVPGKFALHYYSVHPLKQVLRVNGLLMLSNSEISTMNQVLQNIDPRKELILDLSDMAGGYTYDAENFITEIKEICESKRNKRDVRQSCAITTFVGETNGNCGSACIIPFMAGKKRIACPRSVFGFHASRRVLGPFSYQESSSVVKSLLLRLGVFRPWITEHAQMFESVEMTRMTPVMMEGSNILTELNENCDYLIGTGGGHGWQ